MLPQSGHVSTADEPGGLNYASADFFDRVEAAGSSFLPKQKAERQKESNRHLTSMILLVVAGVAVGVILSNLLFRSLPVAVPRSVRRRRQGYQAVS